MKNVEFWQKEQHNMLIRKMLYELELKIRGIKKVVKPEGVQEFDGYSLPDKRLSKLEKIIVKILHGINKKYRQEILRK